jgi:D-xylose transport system substrate-binding protein
MKSKCISLLFLLTVLILTSCRDSLKIGYSIGEISSDRMSQEASIFEEKVKSLGATPLMQYGYGGPDEQLKQAQTLIDAGVDVLVVFPTDSYKWDKVIEAAHKKNIKVIAYERLLHITDVDYYFSFYNQKVGSQQAEYAVAQRPKGNYILLGGPVYDYNSILFMHGQKTTLAPYIERGDIKIVMEKYLNTWSPIDAYIEIQGFLEKNKNLQIDAILAGNDGLAGGCIMALDKMLGIWDIVITGTDASVGGLQNILDGKQSMTVYKPFKDLANLAAEQAVKLAKGEKIEAVNSSINNGFKDVPSVFLETIVVDKNNIRETVVASGFVSVDRLTFPKK